MDEWQFIDIKMATLPETLLLQEHLWQKRLEGKIPNTVIFVENPPNISLGLRPEPEQLKHVKTSMRELERLNIPVVKTGRGGSITVHGPGILGCYVITDISKIIFPRPFVRCLGEWIKDLLKQHSVTAGCLPDELRTDKKDKSKYEGLWVGTNRSTTAAARPRKIASVGVRFKSGVSQYGINLNLSPDDWLLELIYPCGIREYKPTSLKKEGAEATRTEVISYLSKTVSKFLLLN